PTHVRAAYAEEHVLERGGLRRPGAAQVAGEVRVVAGGVAAADAEQGRRGDLPGVDHQAGDIDAADIGDRQWDGAVLGRQGGHPQPQDDRVRAADRDGPVNGVHAGGEKEVPAQGELAVDGGHRVGGPGEEEVPQRDRPAGSRTVRPGRPGAVRAGGRHEHLVLARGVEIQVRPFAAYRVRCQGGVRRAGEGLRGRAVRAREYLVPHRVRPAADAAVADQELLLGAVDDE